MTEQLWVAGYGISFTEETADFVPLVISRSVKAILKYIKDRDDSTQLRDYDDITDDYKTKVADKFDTFKKDFESEQEAREEFDYTGITVDIGILDEYNIVLARAPLLASGGKRKATRRK